MTDVTRSASLNVAVVLNTPRNKQKYVLPLAKVNPCFLLKKLSDFFLNMENLGLNRKRPVFRAFSSSLLCAIIAGNHLPFSKCFQILYIFAQISRIFCLFLLFFALFLKNCTHSLTFYNRPWYLKMDNTLVEINV